jgi:hypothetical protein
MNWRFGSTGWLKAMPNDTFPEVKRHATRFPRIRVGNFGPKNWRIECKDDLGSWDITGPPYVSKYEAFQHVDQTEKEWFH